MAMNLPSLDLVYEAVLKRLDLQFQQVHDLDMKANISLTAAGVILAVLISFLTQQPVRLVQVVVAIVVLVSLSAVLSMTALWVRRYDRPPNVERLRDHYIVRSLEETKLRVIDVSLEAIEHNHGRIRSKIYVLISGYICLAAGVLVLAGYLTARVLS